MPAPRLTHAALLGFESRVLGPHVPAEDVDAARLFEEVVSSSARPFEVCGSKTCGRGDSPRCEHCSVLAADDERFHALRNLLRTDSAAWASAGKLAHDRLASDAVQTSEHEAVLNVLVLSYGEAGAPVRCRSAARSPGSFRRHALDRACCRRTRGCARGPPGARRGRRAEGECVPGEPRG